MINTYLMRRPSLVGDRQRLRDQPVPEAHLWRLTEGMLRSGRLRQVSMAEAEFAEAVARFCPAQAEAIYAKLGLGHVQLPGARKTGSTRGRRTVLLAPPILIDA